MDPAQNIGAPGPEVRDGMCAIEPACAMLSCAVGSRQFVVTGSEALEAHGKADALFGRLENEERGGGPGAELFDELVIHDDFRIAALWKTAHKAGAPDVDLIDLEPQACGQQHPKWSLDAHQARFLIGGFENQHRDADIGPILGDDALKQGAL